MATAADTDLLANYYVKLWEQKYPGEMAIINRQSSHWGFTNVLDSLRGDKKEVKKLLDYYFETTSVKKHSLEWFFYNYDKFIRARIEVEKDKKDRAVLAEQTKKRVEEWRAKHGNQGIANA